MVKSTVDKNICVRLAVIETTLERIDDKTDDIYKSLYGNGRQGLKTKVELNEDNLASLETIFKDHQANMKWMVIVVIAVVSLISGIINYLV